jgi:MULE transposase domain
VLSFQCSRYRAYRARTVRTFDEGKVTQVGTKAGSIHKKKTTPLATDRRRMQTTKATCNDECCPFCLNIFLDSNEKFWYLSVGSLKDHIGMHYGHCVKPKNAIAVSLRHLEAPVLQLANSCRNVGMSATETALLVQEEKALNLNAKQAAYLKLKSMLLTSTSPDDQLTAAERMVQYFDDEKETMSYVMLVNENDKLLVVAKKWGSRHNQDLTQDVLEKSVRDEMLITSSSTKKRTLLLFAWVTDGELQMALMFGQVMSFDCTSQTNKQKRDEFTVTIKDGNNKLCTCMRAFLANQKRSTFHLLFQHVSLLLWGEAVCNRLTFAIMDGDEDQIAALKSAIKVRHTLICDMRYIVDVININFFRIVIASAVVSPTLN